MIHLFSRKILYATIVLISALPGCAQVATPNDQAKASPPKPTEILPIVQFPNYRGMVVQGDNTPWKIKLNAHWSTKWTGKIITVHSTLTNADGKVLLDNTSKQKSTDNAFHLSLQPPKDLQLGNYALEMTTSEPDGKQFRGNASIHVVQKMPGVYVDAQGFTVVNGKRFFPMGVYIGKIKEEDLARIAKGGFNTVLSYDWNTQKPSKSAYLDLAEKYHLKVVYSLKGLYSKDEKENQKYFGWAKSIVETVRDKPALLAWYTNDELGRDWIPELRERYKKLKKLDPQHPTLMIQNKLYDMILEAPYTDILGADPYPVGNITYGNGTLTMSSSWTRTMHRASQGAKGIWMVPQIMDWSIYHKDWKSHPPSLDEMRNQAYQTIINGATGLIWYSYYDLWSADSSREPSKSAFDKRWPDVVAMATEINHITPVILEDKKVLLELPEKAEVEAAAWQNGEKLLILLANPYYEQKSITFALPDGWKIKEAHQGEIKSTFANGKVTFTLPSVGSGVFRLEK